jgi:hypothetical protein
VVVTARTGATEGGGSPLWSVSTIGGKSEHVELPVRDRLRGGQCASKPSASRGSCIGYLLPPSPVIQVATEYVGGRRTDKWSRRTGC